MKKTGFFTLVLFFTANLVYSQGALLVRPSDLRLECEKSVSETFGGSEETAGYHLYIRKVPGLESVMLTETTKDPAGESDNYAYRALEYNSINGDEIRYLDGKVLVSEYSKYSLVDSTAEKDSQFGEAFHIFIPETMQFGYPWTRNGTITIGRGTFLNIRAFAKKYADYTGGFYDNPYMFDFGKKVRKVKKPAKNPPEEISEDVIEEKEEISVLTDDYNPVASAKFQEIADIFKFSKGPDSITEDLILSLKEIDPKKKADVVFVLDATGSMKDDVEKLRKEWISKLEETCVEFDSIRLGLLLYRDYPDSFRFRNLPVKFFDFTDDIAVFEKNLNSFVIKGKEGGDIPEAVYEGLYAALDFYAWDEDSVKKIILVGDAEPHPVPRGTGRYTKKLVQDTAAKKNISITAIITPDEKFRRGR